MKNLRRFTLSLLCAGLGACSSTDDTTGSGGTSSTGDVAGSGGQAGQGGNAGSASTAGSGGTGGQGGNAGSASLGGSGGQGGGAGSANMAGAGGGGGDPSGTNLTGTLGSLGALQPTVSSLVISNSGETLIYLSSAPITCELLTMSRWLGSVAAGSQVVEIVVPSDRATGTVPVEDGGAEVNYAPGGMSSAYEESAESGSVTFTTSTPNGVFEGSVTATYANPAGNVSGTFHAEFCAGGQGY